MPRLTGLKVLEPLRIRDFALLWTGMAVSLLGDGVYAVALVWQVYELSNAPTALSLVGVAWTVPQLAVLLLGGAISDRFERRRVMMAADLLRGAAIAAIGALSVTGALELWHMFVLVAVFGVGGALFNPAFTAILPDVVPRNMLLEANALDQVVRPLTTRMVGPALGGAIIAVFGVGEAFLLDAVTFVASAAALLLMRTRSLPRVPEGGWAVAREIRAGLAYVRSQTWLWGTLLAVTVAMLFFLGPVYVLMPFVVKNELDAGAGGLGLVFGAGGVGAIVGSLAMGQAGFPRRAITLTYVTWSISAFALVGYALSNALWQAVVVSFVSVGSLTVGQVVWYTVMQRLVPAELLGRVASLDSFLSFGLVPLSYALTGPVADALGAETTLLWGGVVSGGVLLAFLFLLRGLRETEKQEPGFSAA